MMIYLCSLKRLAAMCKEFIWRLRLLCVMNMVVISAVMGNRQPWWREQSHLGEPEQWKKTGHCDVVKMRKHISSIWGSCGLDQLLKDRSNTCAASEKDHLWKPLQICCNLTIQSSDPAVWSCVWSYDVTCNHWSILCSRTWGWKDTRPSPEAFLCSRTEAWTTFPLSTVWKLSAGTPTSTVSICKPMFLYKTNVE